MLKNLGWAILATCVVVSVVARAEEERGQASVSASTAPVKLSDAELERITAGLGQAANVPPGAVTVVIFNPGGGYVWNVGRSHTVCINCAGSSESTFGFVLTPQGKLIQIGK